MPLSTNKPSSSSKTITDLTVIMVKSFSSNIFCGNEIVPAIRHKFTKTIPGLFRVLLKSYQRMVNFNN
jgi:hypothetical protein